jgi:hypothetical protein
MSLDIVVVLSAHEGWDYGGPGVVECVGCGCKSERLGPEWNGRRGDRHRAHVAAVLREQIEGAQSVAWNKGWNAGRRDWWNETRTPNPYRAAHLSDTERAES